MKPNCNSSDFKIGIDEKIYKKAKKIAYNFLSYRSRSKGEILSRLISKNIDKKYIDKILIDLENEGFINDTFFAKNYVNYCIKNKLYSKKIIEMRLNNYLIPIDIIEKILFQIYTDEVEFKILKSLVKKRSKGKKKINSRNKSNLFNYLYNCGFNMDKIRDVILKY